MLTTRSSFIIHTSMARVEASARVCYTLLEYYRRPDSRRTGELTAINTTSPLDIVKTRLQSPLNADRDEERSYCRHDSGLACLTSAHPYLILLNLTNFSLLQGTFSLPTFRSWHCRAFTLAVIIISTCRSFRCGRLQRNLRQLANAFADSTLLMQ